MKVTLKIPKPAAKTWTVKGKTVDELSKNMKKHKWWGRYVSNPNYSYKDKGAIVTELVFKPKPVIYMPVWSEYSKASKADKKSWDDMYKALKKHEENHHTILLSESEAWKKTMDKLGDLDKKKMEVEWVKFNKATQAKQDGYDTKTDHGGKEGVTL